MSHVTNSDVMNGNGDGGAVTAELAVEPWPVSIKATFIRIIPLEKRGEGGEERGGRRREGRERRREGRERRREGREEKREGRRRESMRLAMGMCIAHMYHSIQ